MKTIKVDGYPATFEFRIRTELPKWDRSEDDKLTGDDWNKMTCEQYENRKNYSAEQVRNDLLHKHMRRLKVYSPCHAYGDYVVEVVTETSDGEIWHLGS